MPLARDLSVRVTAGTVGGCATRFDKPTIGDTFVLGSVSFGLPTTITSRAEGRFDVAVNQPGSRPFTEARQASAAASCSGLLKIPAERPPSSA